MIAAGPVMLLLFLLSIFSVMLIIVYFFTIRRGAVVTSGYMATADALLRKRDYLGLLAVSNRHGEGIARVVQKTLDFMTKNPNADFAQVREIAETEGTRIATNLHNRVTYLADIATIGPLVGLFGTVIGIIRSFGALGSELGPTALRPAFERHQRSAHQHLRRSWNRHHRDDLLRFFSRARATARLRSRIRQHPHSGAALAPARPATGTRPGLARR